MQNQKIHEHCGFLLLLQLLLFYADPFFSETYVLYCAVLPCHIWAQIPFLKESGFAIHFLEKLKSSYQLIELKYNTFSPPPKFYFIFRDNCHLKSQT